MKKTRIFLVLSFLLCACAPQPVNDPAGTATEQSAATQAFQTPTTQPEAVYRHPLNGQVLSAPFDGQVTAVVINNIRQALPQYGIRDADLIWEVETEGGITRFLAMYTDLEDVAAIGPVRSSRTYFNSLAAGYGAPLIHCGGSGKALSGMHSSTDTLESWVHINEQENGRFFYREQDRYQNQGYDWEHTLFTTGEKLVQALREKNMNDPAAPELGLSFDENAILSGGGAENVKVQFRGGKTTEFSYDDQSDFYRAAQYGIPLTDALYGEEMTFSNVLILHARQSFQNDGYTDRSYYTLTGSGSGYACLGGRMTPILWHRQTVSEPFTFTCDDGSPLILRPGRTYAGITGLTNP